jgi:hypothetical protein
VAFAWQGREGERLLVAVNYAPNQSQCYVRLPFADLDGGQWRLQDQLEEVVYVRGGSDLQSRGLYLDVPPWQASVFALMRGPEVHWMTGGVAVMNTEKQAPALPRHL